MPTLEDRYYATTIPEHGPSPTIDVVSGWGTMPNTRVTTVTVTPDPDRGTLTYTTEAGKVFGVVRMTEEQRALFRLYRAGERAWLRREIGRRCAGHRRRQARVRR